MGSGFFSQSALLYEKSAGRDRSFSSISVPVWAEDIRMIHGKPGIPLQRPVHQDGKTVGNAKGALGKIFLPMREYYRRDKKEISLKPLFPGYLFVYSNMGREELHAFLLAHRGKVASFLKELGRPGRDLSKSRGCLEGQGCLESQGRLEGWGNPLEDAAADLTEEESSFLDTVLDDDGIQRMSAGYRESDGKIAVMEGPLVAYASRIVKVDRHERAAYLNLRFREIDIVAGLEVRPKSHFFPDGKDVPVTLGDGTEVDLLELKKRMMEGQSVYRSLGGFRT